MIALLRYQTAILLRSHRWVFPLIAYGALILTGAAGGTPNGPTWLSLADGRVQLATLLAALGGGIVLAIAGTCFEVIANPPVSGHSGGLLANVGASIAHPVTLAAGLAMAAVCLLVGSAVGALCNPPLLRHPATAMLATLAAAVFALASDVSPAGAALRHASSAYSPHWPGAVQALGAACLLAVTWAASVLVAARRENGSGSAG